MINKAFKTILSAAAVIVALAPATAFAQQRPLFDGHIHYSHDAWEMLPPAKAVQVLRKAGLKKAFVSSSSDKGTQMLYKEAPDLIVPVLRPYRRRGELGTWFRDETVVTMIEGLLAKNRYAGIGEFHIDGANADTPVVRRIVQLAAKYKIFLHAHSDSDAVDRIFAQNPDARVLWAHSGFVPVEEVATMMRKHKNLRADLSFRYELASNGKVNPQWRELFLEFPDRFLLGTDTYTPDRWFSVADYATWSRQWIADLPHDIGENIAFRNAEALVRWAWQE
ncbi:MAG TPA: amidohydrolase family protein [Rhodospirillales bacterium]|jgi:predicted TIM-barrel fold metal-dependent hydrolase|nr:amidohydrolase family protein [Rhodospirillales bacterium]